jgi:hypothetical protein
MHIASVATQAAYSCIKPAVKRTHNKHTLPSQDHKQQSASSNRGISAAALWPSDGRSHPCARRHCASSGAARPQLRRSQLRVITSTVPERVTSNGWLHTTGCGCQPKGIRERGNRTSRQAAWVHPTASPRSTHSINGQHTASLQALESTSPKDKHTTSTSAYTHAEVSTLLVKLRWQQTA